ncbi:YihY/virulence factor BrkB family protein, partial [Salmonella enterica subsp. enterica serovar Paratyphi B]|nr:YihY/virulence factor BrkB family protein [Salmonella enterica subsp. enterica serovar Paratyphi B]
MSKSADRNGSTSPPSPEHEDKPDNPTDLQKRSWKYVLVKSIREFSADQCMDGAAALTYYAVLSIFPGMIAVFSLLGIFGQDGAAADAVLGIIGDVAPKETAEALRGPIEQISKAPGAGVALVFGILLALWSASGYVGAFSRVMNRIYEIEEGRPFWKLRPMQLLVTVITVVSLTIVAIVLVLSGDVVSALGDAIGASEGVQLAWSIAK